MSAAYWWIVLLTYCHVGPVNFHIVSEPDFPNLDFPWSVWEVMLHVSHLAENIRSVSPMTCDRTPNVELFSCSVTVPLSFHLSTLALSLSVYPVGCVCLPDSVTFLSFSQCLFLPRLVSLTAPFKLLLLSLYAVSPSLLSLFLLFWHHHFVPSELVSAFNPIWINIHYTFHRVLCNKRLHSACHSESRKQYVPFPKVRTDLNSPP